MNKQVIVNTSIFALHGNHIYVSIMGGGRRMEYRAMNLLDARSFIERVIQRFFSDGSYEIIHRGDALKKRFVYHHQGD